MDDLQRFLVAQAPVYETVLAELTRGRKETHWMWFVFPQLTSLGRSATAIFYGLDGVADAESYWAHPVLGPRLRACVQAVLGHANAWTAHRIFGSPDDKKFCSCLTLFEVATADACFTRALESFYAGRRDDLTLDAISPRGN